MKLTNEILNDLVYGGRERAPGKWTTHVVWDDLDGFGVRLYPSGKKSWVLKYVNKYRKQRWYTIGPFPELSATAARKEAERLRRVVAEGGDPRADVQGERSGLDINELCDEYLEKYAKERKKSWEHDEARIDRVIRPRWGKKHPGEITRSAVAKLHRDLAETSGKVTANRTLALVSKMFAWSIQHELHAGDNPAAGIEMYPEKPKDRWVQHDEMRWVLDAIDLDAAEHRRSGKRKHSRPEALPEAQFIRTYFLLILYTGARKSEMLEIEWSDIHLGRKEITFRDTKNGEDHTLPLCEPAVELLRALPRVEGNPYVFVGRRTGSHLKSVMKAWTRIRDRATKLALEAGSDVDVSDVTIHDLRRTVGAWLATAGYSELLIGRVLNHKVRSVTGIYARIADEAVTAALEAHARQLANVRRPADGKVIELRR